MKSITWKFQKWEPTKFAKPLTCTVTTSLIPPLVLRRPQRRVPDVPAWVGNSGFKGFTVPLASAAGGVASAGARAAGSVASAGAGRGLRRRGGAGAARRSDRFDTARSK